MRCVAAFLIVLSSDFRPAIDASRAQLVALMEKAQIPGAAVAVTVGDRIVWREPLGVTNLDSKAPVTLQTRFRVGSLTKLMTATALMRLAHRGRLHLDDRVRKHLPDFPHGAITLRQLAGHLSGIRHYGFGEFMNTTHFDSATESLTRFADDPLLSPPGERYFYSTYGYNVLGAIIERITGQNFQVAMRSLLFEPVGMSETSFVGDANTTTFYDRGKNGPVVAPQIDLSDRLPAGAAVTTARDLGRFLIATTGGPLLTEKARATMFRSQRTSDGKPTNVGIGWRVAKDEKGRTFLHHGGAVTGGRAFLLVYPRERVGVAIVTNLGFVSFDEKDAVAIAARFLDAQ